LQKNIKILKRILIISPHFPPNNTPDMHRIRAMLPYFQEKDIEVCVLAINPEYTEAPIDKYILKSIPENIKIYKSKALKQKVTRKLGLGNLGIRAFFYMKGLGNRIIKEFKPDVIFFSTTVFALLPLGRIWRNKFKIPYIIDMQDPWRNDYYLTIPKSERPPKFWFAHRLNSILERYTMPHVSGIVSVNSKYIEMLINRYPKLEKVNSLVLPLGATKKDFYLVNKLNVFCPIKFDNSYVNAVYTGVVPDNMKFSVEAIIIAVKKYNETAQKKIRLYFIGTNYAPKGKQKFQIKNIAEKYKFSDFVFEFMDRIPYFEAIKTMQIADLLLLPGTLDDNYTASKLYPYILTKNKVLAVFNEKSELKNIINKISNIPFIPFNKETNTDNLSKLIYNKLNIILNDFKIDINDKLFEKYTAKAMTKTFVDFLSEINSK